MADLRADRIPLAAWKDKPAKLSHKDRHARWTLKFIKAQWQDDGTLPPTDIAIPFFGYKSHVSIDRKFRLIRKWKATDAAASDSARLREWLLDRSNTASDVWADKAYRPKANEAFMEKLGFVSKIHRKKPHLKPMSRHIQRSNAGKPVIRSRVEHVFADQKSQMGLFIRTVAITRATMKIGLANIVYNMRCFLFLKRIDAISVYFHHATPGLDPKVELYQNREWGLYQRDKALRSMHYFDALLKKQPFIVGEDFSMADIAVIGGFIFAAVVKLPIPQECSALLAWYARMQEHPSVRD